jgi:dTDP-4-dehydrorhamnose 3,5-epimerase
MPPTDPAQNSDTLVIETTSLPGVLMISPPVFRDERGWLSESYNRQALFKATGINTDFVQDTDSTSARGVLRGLHFQNPHPQAKLVRCLRGEIFDVVVDIRRSSATFGLWTSATLSGDGRRQLWIPEGFAHGFLAMTNSAHVAYKTTRTYDPVASRTIAWNDPDLAIDWPLEGSSPILSPKDASARALLDAALFE